MIFVRKIDTNGFFIEDDFVSEITSDCIETPCPDGFYLPKWNGAKWIEGRTAEEIAALKTAVMVEPSDSERLTALETTTDDILTVLEAII